MRLRLNGGEKSVRPRGQLGRRAGNWNGRLVGIDTAIVAPTGGGNVGTGFAVPVNAARMAIERVVGRESRR